MTPTLRKGTTKDYERLYLTSQYGLAGSGFTRRAWFCQAIKKHAELGSSIVDVGCGRGLLLRQLKELGYDVKGVETEEMLGQFCAGICPWACAKLPDLSSCLADNSVDVVICNDVLEHLESAEVVEQSIVELCRVSRQFVTVSVGLTECSASSWLPDGGEINLHIVVRPHEWWAELLSRYCRIIESPNPASSSFFFCEVPEGGPK